MLTGSFLKTKKKTPVKAGSLLVAQPFWQDERYKRSVILLLEHDYKGSIGIILNKPSTLSTYEVIPDLRIGLPMYFGGPTDNNLISFIHTNHDVPDAIPLGHDLYYGGNYETLAEMILKKEINLGKIKFFSGFTQWEKGQMAEELRENKWWNTELTAENYFKVNAEDLWAFELINSNHPYGLFDEFPDPGTN